MTRCECRVSPLRASGARSGTRPTPEPDLLFQQCDCLYTSGAILYLLEVDLPMQNVRRILVPGASYFITVVTYRREPLLLTDTNLFHSAWSGQDLYAWVVLPDHFHAVMCPSKGDISGAVHRFKIRYSRYFRDCIRPGRVWQNRFWDHLIRDEADLKRHTDYIHYNAVKHHIAATPIEHSQSSLAEFLSRGQYDLTWGKMKLDFDGDFGE